jgi:hypothetical protein
VTDHINEWQRILLKKKKVTMVQGQKSSGASWALLAGQGQEGVP